MTPRVSRSRNWLARTLASHPGNISRGKPTTTARISKIGDETVRTALYQAAHIILTRPVKASALKTWATQLARRAGMAKAKVALARKLAVIMHRMLVDGKLFDHMLPKQAPSGGGLAPTG